MSRLRSCVHPVMAIGRRSSCLAASLAAVAALTSGCTSDPDCGICDPNRLVLESLAGVNYDNTQIHLLTQGRSSGRYFTEELSPCLESEAANDPLQAQRGPEQWCKLSPLISLSGLEMVFNNLLDPTTVELVRLDPSNPNLFEIYDWKHRIAEIHGPITRYNGDYFARPGEEPDTVTRAVNLTCIDNLRALGRDFDHEVLAEDPDICVDVYEADGRLLPLKLQAEGVTRAPAGQTDPRAFGCSTPPDGPDTCCNVCDFELSVNVAKYGLDGAGEAARGPSEALACTLGGNIYEDCADFEPFVDRSDEVRRFRYAFAGEADEFRLPLSDKIRETHPDRRPEGIEPVGLACQRDADCDAALGSESGAACIGTTPEGVTCNMETEGCGEGHCRAEWFVTCRDDLNLGQSLCVDARFKDRGAGACYVALEDFESCTGDACVQWSAGRRLALCDGGSNPDGNLSAAECCQASLGGEASCDPLFQANIRALPRFDRDRLLPSETRSCFCGDPDGQDSGCAAQIERLCTPPWGTLTRHDGSSNEGDYLTRFVSKRGGVIYDPALKGVLFVPADTGGQPRSRAESCAESNNLIDGRNIQDGWRMHDGVGLNNPESFENFDRGLCSGSRYTLVLADEGQVLRDKLGNTVDETEYAFETAEFQVVPDSGQPLDGGIIGPCDDFSVRLSNKYDLSPGNLGKVELVELSPIDGREDSNGDPCRDSQDPLCWTEGRVVGGGLACSDDPLEVDDDTPPCLIVDVTEQVEGRLTVSIDQIRFGPRLSPEGSGRYRLRLPGLDDHPSFEALDLRDPDDLAAYRAAFHDVCGMPLINRGGEGYTDFYFDFTIDEPRCREDEDGDGVVGKCDNAPDHFNPAPQPDQDLDGFGDIVDRCVLTPSGSNTGDSDRDGVGNDCDSCRQRPSAYGDNDEIDDVALWVRNNPSQIDRDQDGIGDVCDNCVVAANCGVFGPAAEGLTPHSVGVPVLFDDPGVCQRDSDEDRIGDACRDSDSASGFLEADDAAGPVGFAPEDDFDQDGIANGSDSCPRLAVAIRQACTSDDECDSGGPCSEQPANDGLRYCGHLDSDNDGVGNICDTCPFASNPMQVTDTGQQLDDPDDDFVGNACEAGSGCEDAPNARPYAFMEVAANGLCCATSYPGDGRYVTASDGGWGCEGLCDPDGFPIRLDCDDEAEPGIDEPDGVKCRQLPESVRNRPGVVDLPPGCADALADAGRCAPAGADDPDCPLDSPAANRRLTLADIDDPDALWGRMCRLPQWDQDFDGLGDACDLCSFAFDPNNEPFVNENTGVLEPNLGRFCNGRYSPDALCAAAGGDDEGETGTDTGTDSGTDTEG